MPELAFAKGVMIAAVTPRRANEQSIDLAATLEMLDVLSQSGAQAICLLGATGEFPHFVLEDRARMLEFAVKRSRLPLLVNVSSSTLDGAIQLGEEAAGVGVAGMLLAPPYFYRYEQDSLLAFYLRFVEAIGRETPIFLYNLPTFTNALSTETISGLLRTGMFAGIKDSSGNPELFAALQNHEDRSRFALFVGNDRLYTKARMSGANGVISGVACAIPELLLALEAAIENNNLERVNALDRRLQDFLDWLDQFPAPVAIKEAARERGMKVGVPAIPLGERLDAKLIEFQAWFASWLDATLNECGASKKA